MDIQIIELSNPLWLRILQKLRHDIYHLPEYVYLESRRISAIPEAVLIVEDEKILFIPYLLRQCNELFDQNFTEPEIFDITSPYGYPGILLSDEAANSPEFVKSAVRHLLSVLYDKHIYSAFFRLHPILDYKLNEIFSSANYKLTGETVSVNLKLSEAEIWHQTRPEHRTKINRCKRSGMIAEIVPLKQYINEFISIYKETMDRVGAVEAYYFNNDYFIHLLNLNEKIHLCVVQFEEQVICAALFSECCGIVQYHLGGTRNQFLKSAPSALMFDYVRFWFKERGNEIFHLGGGVGSSKDSLYHFKAGFSKQRHNFSTLRLITDENRYHKLLELRAKFLNIEVEKLLNTDFFPAYRSPVLEYF